ncbi:TIGR03792 family protein [Prochlorococcus sp. MIT 1011]|uniref:TIGR03792 family protein n=1 Tax=Prochlorococcus sp. MIT 1011 TaxID=3082520 RepID=UPI0039B512CE
MKTSRKKNLIEKILRFLFVTLIFISTVFGNVKNIQAESLLKVNFPKESIVEHLKLDVPKKFKHAWLKAEEGSWEPWLLNKDGFLGRQLFWDPKDEEAILLIAWKSRDLWKKIPQSEVNFVQKEFENIARKETGETTGNPFPLIYEGELIPE